MINTSNAFQEAVNKDFRNFKSLLMLHFSSNENYPFAFATATSSEDETCLPQQACDGRINISDFKITGIHLSKDLELPHKGWRSKEIAGPNGILANPQILTITYFMPEKTNNLWLISQSGYIPVDFKVEYDDGSGWKEIANIQGNNKEVWSLKTPNSLNVQKLRLTITKTQYQGNQVRVLQFGIIHTLILDDDYISDINILEEAKAETSNPIGGVTSNECTLTLRNDNYWFSQNNENSPLYGLVRPNIKFKPYIGVEISPDIFEFIPMGSFRSTDWDAPTDSIEASITGLDRLNELGQMPVPLLPVKTNTNVGELIKILLKSLGLTENEYIIDPAIKQPINIGWIPKGKVYDAFNELSIAGNCTIIADRFDRVIATSNFIDEEPVAEINDNNQIIIANNPQKLLDTYSKVDVSYVIPSISDIFTEVLNIKEIELRPGVTTLNNLSFTSGPVYILNRINLIGATNCRIIHIEYGAWGINLKIANNSNKTQIVDIQGTGKIIELIKNTLSSYNFPILAKWGEKTLSVESELIQNPDSAKTYSRAILAYVSDPARRFKATLRGNPALQLLDTINFVSDIDNIPITKVIPVSQKFTYNGGLECEFDARKPIIPMEYVFVTPSLTVLSPLKVK